MIYLASPYSHVELAVQELRFKAACIAVAKIMQRGQLVFSPIAHSHSVMMFSNGKVSGEWKAWSEFDTWFIDRCDELWVLCIDGWQQSTGVQQEVNYAKLIKKVVRHISEELQGICLEGDPSNGP